MREDGKGDATRSNALDTPNLPTKSIPTKTA